MSCCQIVPQSAWRSNDERRCKRPQSPTISAISPIFQAGIAGIFQPVPALGRVPDTHFVCLRKTIGGETPEAPVFWPFSLDTQAKARQFSNLSVTLSDSA